MESTLFTALSTNEEASLSGGGSAPGGGNPPAPTPTYGSVNIGGPTQGNYLNSSGSTNGAPGYVYTPTTNNYHGWGW